MSTPRFVKKIGYIAAAFVLFSLSPIRAYAVDISSLSSSSPNVHVTASSSSGSALLLFILLLLVVVASLLFFLLYHRKASRKLEETIAERTQALEIASQAKSDFLSRMSHEIRTPLSAIIGMANISRNKIDTNPKQSKENIDEIINASNHLLGILNDILDMSKIESGKFEIDQKPFSLPAQMQTVENIINQRCAEKSIQLQTRYTGLDHLLVLGDKLRLNQVLINLLGNAVKFTNPKGTVLLDVSATTTESEATVSFRVEDTGIGMSPAQLSRLFVPFEQADKSIASRFGGTGLGLAISQNLVKQMGGRIHVESQEGKGSCFSFQLILPRTQELPTPAVQSVSVVPDLKGKRILIVEDIEINRAILTELLKGTNATFDEAINGKEAVAMIAAAPEHYYDLVFMDIQMPVMGGYEASQRIRSFPRQDARTIPIIAMTASAYNQDVEKSIEAGMDGHLSKPVDLQKVWRVLSEWVLHKAA